MRSYITCSISAEVDTHVKRNSELWKSLISDESRASSSKTEARSDYKYRHRSKESPKSKRTKFLRTGNDMFGTSVVFNTNRLLENSFSYDDQIVKHVVKFPSRLQPEMNGKVFSYMDVILITAFLHAFIIVWDNESIPEGATMVLAAFLWECRQTQQ